MRSVLATVLDFSRRDIAAILSTTFSASSTTRRRGRGGCSVRIAFDEMETVLRWVELCPAEITRTGLAQRRWAGTGKSPAISLESLIAILGGTDLVEHFQEAGGRSSGSRPCI